MREVIAALKVCAGCRVPQPLGAYYPDRKKGPPHVARVCKACVATRRAAAEVKRKAGVAARREAQARTPPVPGVAARRVGTGPPTPAPPSLRRVFEQETAASWPKLVRKAVRLAVDGDKPMLRLVMAYAMGRPGDAPEEDPVGEFWTGVLAAAQHVAVGDHPGRAPLRPGDDADLGEDRVSPDPGGGDGP